MEYINKLKLAHKTISSSKRVLLVSHLSPDADAISSLGALIEFLKNNDIDFYAFAKNKKEGDYSFIPNENLISSVKPENIKIFDSIVILDCGSIQRTGLEDEILETLSTRKGKKPFFIEIDHHEKVSDYADLEIRRQDKASTTSIIYDLLKVNNSSINKSISDCILSGLMGDTGCFIHSNSSSEAISLASEMLSYGASFHKILRATTKNSNFLSLKIWGKVIENLHFNSNTGLLSSGLTIEDIESLKEVSEENEALAADLFGVIVSFMCSFSEVRVALLLREENGMVKGSLRTNNDNIDLAQVANKFGGGGHKKAAGFSVPGKLIQTDNGWKIKKEVL